MCNKLKPCPFCDASVTLENNQSFKNPNSDTLYWIECSKCMAFDFESYTSANRCISAWNTRPIEDALRKEIAQLQADNRSLVEQMNKMALKPNQEIIEWHECSEGVPTDSGHYLILCEDGDVYIGWFNNGSDEAGNPEDHCPWGNPEWLIEVQDPGAYKVIAWAYMPKGVINEHKAN